MSACDITIRIPIYKVQLKMRSINELYVFVGHIKDDLEKIYEKITNKKALTKDEQKILNNCEYCTELLACTKVSKKCTVKFINQTIYTDDTIETIKNKIFIYLSKTEEDKYYIPENQELWVYNEDNKPVNLGFTYTDIKYTPSTTSKVSIDMNILLIKMELKNRIWTLKIKINYYYTRQQVEQ